MSQQSYALISVSDKSDIELVAQALIDAGVKLLSTGGTLKALTDAGIPAEAVEEYTDYPEMMDGRVKTLHPKIHGGLLADRLNESHVQTLKELEIGQIDYLIVNLYPFKETIEQEGSTLKDAIENIDIGGPSMLRSAAKNYQSVTVVTDPKDYHTFIEQLKEFGKTTVEYRQYLATKVFQQTSFYDNLIAQYLDNYNLSSDFTKHSWDFFTHSYENAKKLRYGENSHQQATYYQEINPAKTTIAQAKQIHGKEMSYNNYKDADTALDIVLEFQEPAVVAVKHMNPCGVGIGENINEAFDRAYLADNVSIFGGIIALNRSLDETLAKKLSKIFLEIIIAPDFSDAALEVLKRKKNLRLLTLDMTENRSDREIVSISGGILIQDGDQSPELSYSKLNSLPDEWKVMTDTQPNMEQINAMNFLMKVAKHVKSNAIVVGNQRMTLGIGAGQMNRVGAAEIALKQAKNNDSVDSNELILASDAFLPMSDTVELAAKYGVQAIIQPGGSKKDQDSIDLCNEKGISMVATGYRHFRH